MGVTRVTEANLKAIQAALASANDATQLNTLTGLQAVVTAAANAYSVALAKIQSYAQDPTNSAPSAQDYKDIGIPGVTQDNLAAVNSQIDASNASGTSSPALILPLVNQGIAAQQAALQKIANYADNHDTNPAPTADDYKTAGIQGVTAANLTQVNSQVDGATRDQADTVLEVQGLVNTATSGLTGSDKAKVTAALAKITAYADNGSNPAPSVQDYADADISGVTQINLAAVNAQVDAAIKTDADTHDEVQDLATAGAAAQQSALRAITAYANNSNSTAPTANTYKIAGIQGVNEANLTSANAKVAAVTGDDANSVEEVQGLVNSASTPLADHPTLVAALAKIAAYADNASNPAPTAQDYAVAGVTGLDGANQPTFAMVNSVLATAVVTGREADTTREVQALVDAYAKVLALADGNIAAGTPLTLAEAALLGVDVNGWSANDPRLSLLNSELDHQTNSGVNSADKISWLAQMASNIQKMAAGNDMSHVVSAQDLTNMGLQGVTTDNLMALERAIAAKDDTGSETNTLGQLQALIDSLNSAVRQIANAADANTASDTNVSLAVLQAAGIQNLSGLNLPLLQGLLNSTTGSVINGDAVNTVSKIQALVDAVQLVQQLANGTGADTTPAMSDAQITALGLQNVINTQAEKALFTDVLDRAAATNADQASEISALAGTVDRIYNLATGNALSPALTAAELTALGLHDVNPNLLSQLSAAISATSGSGVSTLAQLQVLVNQVNQNNAQPTMTIAEAANGVSATEVADGVSVVINLPVNSQANQVIKLVVTSPDASVAAKTVNHVITAEEAAAQSFTLTLGSANFKNSNSAYVDGSYTLQSTLMNGTGPNATALSQTATTTLTLDTLPPTLTVTRIAGDDVNSGNHTGQFDAAERGIAVNDVATPLVISGTTDAQGTGAITVTLNNHQYTCTPTQGVNGLNNWSLTLPAADAIALVHGSTYNLTVQAQDTAGNTTIDSTTYKLLINTARPDTPTITSQLSHVTTPTLSGSAQKIINVNGNADDPSNYTALSSADTIEIKVGGTTLFSGNVVDGNGFSYNATTRAWSLDTSRITGFTALAEGTQDVIVKVTAGNVVKIDGSVNELTIKTAPPTLVLNPVAGDNIVNAAEKGNDIVLSGTTDAAPGTTVTATFNGINYTGQVSSGASGKTFAIKLLSSALASIAEGTQTLTLALTNEYGAATTLSRSITFDTVAPTGTPTVSIPELDSGVNATEMSDGLQAVVTLPAGVVTGDKVIFTITRPNGSVGSFEYTLTGADGANVNINIPRTVLVAQGNNAPADGSYTLNAFIRDAAGNTGPTNVAQTFTVDQIAPGQNADGSPAVKPVPVVTIAEAANGINATELANGIQALVDLPTGSVVGDKLTFTLAGPGNTSSTYIYTLTATDVNAGTPIAVTIPASTVSKDGSYSVTAISSDAAGNTSSPSTAIGFTLTASLNTLQEAAQNNSASNILLATYTNAGITGIGGSNQPTLDMINSALNSTPINSASIDTVAKMQDVVDAYKAILNNATGTNSAANTITDPSMAQYAAIGVTGVDTDPEVKLLGNVIDHKASNDLSISTEGRIQDLATAVQHVMDGSPTQAELELLGITGVTPNNIAAVQAAINLTADASLDTLAHLQAAVNTGITNANGGLDIIKGYADANGQDLANHPAPTASNYTNLGVTGMGGSNQPTADMINSALASTLINSAAVDSREKVQAVIDAYQVILNNAVTASSADATAQQYADIGIEGITGTDAAYITSLLGNVIDGKGIPAVNTEAKIQDLATAAQHVMQGTATVADLQALGVTGASIDNIQAVQAKLLAANHATQLNTLSGLQAVVNSAVTLYNTAATKIANYAENDGANNTPTPDATDYSALGVSGMGGGGTQPTVDMINSVLLDPQVQRAQANTQPNVQAIVDAYHAVLTAADSIANNTPAVLTLAQYTTLGIEGVTGTATTGVLKLLNDTVSAKGTDDVSTDDRIQALANAAAAVLAGANNGTPAPTLAQLTLLGQTNVNVNNLAAVQAAIANKPGTDVDSQAELSAVIANAITAYNSAVADIQAFAQANSSTTNIVGTPPSLATYVAAGVTGVTSAAGAAVGPTNNLAAINDALATATVDQSKTANAPLIQGIVNAYNKVFALADGGTAAGSALRADEFALLGLNIGAAATDTENLALLNSILDKQTANGVDTIAEIENLARIANAIQTTAAGGTPSTALTAADLTLIGLTGVTTASNLAAVLGAIKAKADDGSQTSSLQDLQSLATTAITSMGIITAYADNASSNPAPTPQNYSDIGVTGLGLTGQPSVATLNTVLADADITSLNVNTPAGVQSIVDAYQVIVNNATAGTNTVADASRTDYSAIGINRIDAAEEVSLLGNVIDRKTPTQVDTVAKIQDLADAVQHVMDGNATQAELETLGVTGVSPANLKAVQAALALANDATDLDTLAHLQTVVTNAITDYTTAVNAISQYAQTTPSTTVGTAPNIDQYKKAGVTGVSDGSSNSGGSPQGDNLAAINSALATLSIDSAQANTQPLIQDIVNAYNKVFALADGGTAAGTALTAPELGKLGATTAAAITDPENLALLNSILDSQASTDINTVAKIENLARIANAIQAVAATATGVTYTTSLTVADLNLIGLSGVNDNNIQAFLNAVRDQNDSGSATDALSELITIFNNILSVTITGISDDTGYSSSDFITSDISVTIRGTSTASAGSHIKVVIDNGAPLYTTVQNGGSWSVNAPSLTDGNYTLHAYIVSAGNSAGAVLKAASDVTLSVDTQANNNPDGSADNTVSGKSVSITSISPDTGTTGDFSTNAPTVTISGTSTASAGAHIAVSIGGVSQYTTVQSGGTWSIGFTGLANGSQTITARLEDTAGNQVSIATQTLTIDTNPLTLVSKDQGSIATTADLSLTFSANVTAQSGKNITIYRISNDSVFETISVTDSRVTVSGRTVTLNPTNNLVVDQGYYAKIDSGAFLSSTASYDGLSDTTWNFTGRSFASSVNFAGTNVNASNGINNIEKSNLTLTGQVTGSFTGTPTITQIQLIPTDGSTAITLTSGLPTVDGSGVWTLANGSWVNNLVSGRSYSVQVTLSATVAGTPHTVVSTSASAPLFDFEAPGTPTVLLGSGVDNGATEAEATAAGGVVTVNADNGVSTTVTFTNGANSVTKTITGTGSAQAVALTSQELSTLGNGTISVSAVSTDSQGNSSNPGTTSFTLDTAAPSAPTGITVTANGGTVVANTLNSTNTSLSFSATLTAGQATDGKAEFWVGGVLIGTDNSISSTDTTVSYTTNTATTTALQAAIAAGGTVEVRLYDKAGNLVTATGPTLTYDVTAPGAPGTNLIATDDVINLTEATAGFTLSGTGEAGATVNLSFNSGHVLSAGTTTTVQSNGTWSISVDATDVTAFGQGAEVLTVTQTDSAGNPGTTSATRSFSVDTAAPTATLTAATLPNSNNAQVQSTETGTAYLVNTAVNVTNLASITGAADNQVNSVAINTAGANTNLALAGLIDGNYKLYTVDAAGNLSAASSNTFTVDSTPPTLSSSTPLSVAKTTVAGSEGDSPGETIILTVTFDGPVNGLTNGLTNTTIFKVSGVAVSATWGGSDGTNTRTLTYTIASGQNGQATLDEAALQAALVAGISDAAGNAFAYSGTIPDFDVGNEALPVIDTTAPDAPASAPSGYKDDVGSVQSNNSTAANTDDTTPGFLVGANLTTTPKLYVNGTLVASTYNAAAGTLTPNAPIAEGSYAFTYTLTDNAGNESAPSPARTILIDQNNNAPVFTSGSTGSVAENAATSTVIYTAITTDADAAAENKTVVYSFKNDADDHSLLSINSSTGQVTLNNSADFENKTTYTFTIVATNVGMDATLSTEKFVTVSVTNVNEAPVLATPTAIALTDTAVADTFTNRTGTLSATDPDTGTTLSYGLTGGTTGGTDVINTVTYDIKKVGTYGTLYLVSTGADKGKYVYEPNATAINAISTDQSDTFTVSASDGSLLDSQTLTVNITGTNDTPTVSAGTQSATLVEAGGVGNGTPGTASATIALTKGDVDGTASFDTSYLTTNGWSTADTGATYTKAGTYGTATLTTATGVVSYALNNTSAATQALTANQAVTDSFTVQVTDGVATSSVAASFAITGSNDAPTVSTPTTITLDDTSATDTFSDQTGTLSASDPENSTLTYGISTGTTGGSTTISSVVYDVSKAGTYGTLYLNSTTGAYVYRPDATAINALNADASETFTVTASDGSLTGNNTLTVSLTGTPDGPTTGQTTINLGTGNGQLMAPVQVEGRWYYVWDRNGDGQHDNTSVGGVTDYTTPDYLEQTFFGSSAGTVITDSNRKFTINGIKVALPTANGGVAYPQNIDNVQNGTSYTDPGPISNGTSSSFNELLAIWDAFNGTGTGNHVSGTPPNWRNSAYWSATPSASGHAYVFLANGSVSNGFDTDILYVALQVLFPATFTAASYERVSNTFKLTGTDMYSLGDEGVDIKADIDWSKFGYDTDGNGVVDVTFDINDIASARVINATTLEVALNAGSIGSQIGAYKLENAANFDSTIAAVGNADKLILTTNAAASNSNAANLAVTQAAAPAGLGTINLGSYGNLIKGIQVEGKWYYHWDRSGDGTSVNTGPLNSGADWATHDTLDLIFTQDINGNAGGGGNTTDTFRYATLNGVKVALPTYGAGVDGSGRATPTQVQKAGTAVSNNTTTDNPTYNDLLAIWDSQNGSTLGATGVSGTPAGWAASTYWSATPSASGHAFVDLPNGYVYDVYPDVNYGYVALQVLNPATFTTASYLSQSDTFRFTGTDFLSLGDVGVDIKSYINWANFGYDTDGNGASDVSFTVADIASAKVTSATTLEVVLNAGSAGTPTVGAYKLERAPNFDSTTAASGAADRVTLATNAANAYSNAANLAVTQAVLAAGEATIALGAGYGQLIAPVQVEGKWYYHWDLSGNGSATVSGTGTNGVSTNATNGTTAGSDVANHDFLDGIFTQSIYGSVNSGSDTTETYRYATINGMRVALPTYGAGVDGSGLATSTGFNNGTAVSNTTTDNPTYNDLLAIWDAHNGSGTGFNISGTPTGWQANSYWSATGSSSGHAYVVLLRGDANNIADSSISTYVALQVLAPTTLTAASYSRAVDTFTVTGTAFDSAGNVGDDIKAYLDWSKFGYDTDGNNASDVSFDVSEIASATVVSATQLNIVLQTNKAATLEGLLNFDTTTAAVNGADKVITQKGFTDTVYNPSTQVRDAWQSQDASSLGVTHKTSLAGDAIIDLGSNGKLIAPVQVEGKWYYYWDRSGNGAITDGGSFNGGVDTTSHNVLDGIFNKDINGIVNTTVVNADGQFGTTETYRYATINGVTVALPTDGNISSSSHFLTSSNGGTYDPASPGTSAGTSGHYYAKATSGTAGAGTTTNAAYDDFLAIWDATNTTKNDSYAQGGFGSGYEGAPAGWQADGYWSATPSASGHAYVTLNHGSVVDSTDNILLYVALQVL